MMINTEPIKMKYVACPCCGSPLFRVSGNCNVDISCPNCNKTIICDIDDIYISIFESETEEAGSSFGIQKQYAGNVTAFCR